MARGSASEQAFELALAPPARGLVIGVSHEGATRATNAALGAARAAGAQTAVITVSAGSPAAALAGIVVETGELDHGWCHTIGYLSPVVAAAAVGAHLSGRTARPCRAWPTWSPMARATPLARSGSPPGSPTPRTCSSSRPGRTGRRAASSCSRSRRQPGCRPPTAISRHSCTATCRQPAGTRASSSSSPIAIGGPERLARARQALAAAKVIGLRAAAIVASGVDAELDPVLTPAGRLVTAEAPDLPAPVAALLGSATPLQLMTERLARARGTNPDLIRREDPVYLAAADAADAPSAEA